MTVTVLTSVAVPLKEGVVFFDGEGGWPRVTAGAAVLIVNVLLTLLLLPALSLWLAWAV